MDRSDITIIGVDGGATRVRATAVECDLRAGMPTFQTVGPGSSRTYAVVAGFSPMPAEQQLAAREHGRTAPDRSEVRQGRIWIDAAAAAVFDVARERPARRVLVGICMPGLKTADGRGIAVLNHGPRIPDYLDAFEAALRAGPLELIAPIAALGSDGDYCGLGEEYAASGAFRDVQHAYYVGGGTGLADALKLDGRLAPFDSVNGWLLKSWRIPSALGPSFESLISAAAINRVYARLTGRAAAPADPNTYPEASAAAGDRVADAWLHMVAALLAELLFERLWTIRNGRSETPDRGDEYRALDPCHACRGIILDRLVVGQQLARLMSAPETGGRWRSVLESTLARLIATTDDAELRGACLVDADAPPDSTSLRSDLIRFSHLPSAAIGAAVAALRAVSPW